MSRSPFSERFGFTKPRMPLDHSQFPDSLRNGLWDMCNAHCFRRISLLNETWEYSEEFHVLTMRLWHDFLKVPFDERPEFPDDALQYIRKFYFAAQFFRVFDFIEFLCENFTDARKVEAFQNSVNQVLEREQAAFRLIDSQFVAVTAPDEVQSISVASSSSVDGVRLHIRRSAELLSDPESPDYRNSIKEAISAVEAAVAYASGRNTGGVSKPLRAVINELVVHPALRDGFEKLYAYTSDAGGIRHAIMKDGAEPTQEDAKYMLVSCSAFANYLVSLKSKK